MPRRIKPKLRDRYISIIKRTNPWMVLRFIVITTLCFPVWIWVVLLSYLHSLKWRRPQMGRRFMLRHALAFSSLGWNAQDLPLPQVTVLSGGISNLGLLWEISDREGNPQRYFVKVFLPLGTFWAWICPIVSPFPDVYASRAHERLSMDVVLRTHMAEKGADVARLVAFDPVEKVMVTEYLEGRMVDQLMGEMESRGELNDTDREIIRQCGLGLARAHLAGVCLVDAQPANCLWDPEKQKVYFVDLEFSSRSDHRVWDVGFFLCYIKARMPGQLGRQVRKLLVESYESQHVLDWAGVTETNKQLREYVPVFQAILALREFTAEELFQEFLT